MPSDLDNCTSNPAAPIVDTLLTMTNLGSAIYVAGQDNVANKGVAVMTGALLATVWLSSAIYGYSNTSECRAAQDDYYHPHRRPHAPPAGYPQAGPSNAPSATAPSSAPTSPRQQQDEDEPIERREPPPPPAWSPKLPSKGQPLLAPHPSEPSSDE